MLRIVQIALFALVALMVLPPVVQAERVANYEDALARAKSSGVPILVYQYGSDWNRLSMRILEGVWQSPDLEKALGQYLLVAVDQPESAGSKPLAGSVDAQLRPGAADPSVDNRLKGLVENAISGGDELRRVESGGGAVFSQRSDGAFIASGDNPAKDTLTCQLVPASTGQLLRIDFLMDDSLPGRGPGRASNGNFVLNEIEVSAGGKPLSVVGAWASYLRADSPPRKLIDRVTDQPKECWNAHGNKRKRRSILLALARPIESGRQVDFRLISQSAWGQHVPGCIAATIVDDKAAAEAVIRYTKAQRGIGRNAAFRWRGIQCPRVALMDSSGRHVACFDNPRAALTVDSLIGEVKRMQAILDARDEAWDAARSASGAKKAELLRQGLDAMTLGNSQGQDKCYRSVHDEMRKADPDDESGAIRWLAFAQDSRHGCGAIGKSVHEKIKVKDFAGALAEANEIIADPRNKILDHDRMQRLHMLKFHVYRQWPDHQEERFGVLREIADLDDATFFGIGAVGYLEMHHKTDKPSALYYGWSSSQINEGKNAWRLHLDAHRYFDHDGPYSFKIIHRGGKDALTVNRIRIMVDGELVGEARELGILEPKKELEARVVVRGIRADKRPEVLVDLDASGTDSSGRFSIEPLLE